VWRVDGKVKEINRPSTSTKKKLKFDYDAMGNRIAKHVFDNQTGLLERSTYYILDAQGNQLTTYEHVVDNSTANFVLKERHIFGSSRLGMLNEDVNVLTAQIGQNVQHEVGKKYYELSNHLGNVLTVITDKKLPHSSNGTTVDYYTADVISATDYFPFGSPMPGRTFDASVSRRGYQGSEKTDEISGEGNSYTTFFRQLDPRIGRWWSIDPVYKADQSPYVSMSNNPITRIDPKGDDDYFDTKGNFIRSDNKTTRTIYIVDKKGIETQLVDYQFKKYNAFALARIGRYYAKEAGVKMSDLYKGCFSVSNSTTVLSEGGQLLYRIESWFNNGGGDGEDVANYSKEKNTITFSLHEGKVYKTLSDGWNFISLLKHERDHKDNKEEGVYEHLSVYLKQVQDPSFAKTTTEWKEHQTANIQELMNSLEPGSDWTDKQKESLKAYKKDMKAKFNKAGVEVN